MQEAAEVAESRARVGQRRRQPSEAAGEWSRAERGAQWLEGQPSQRRCRAEAEGEVKREGRRVERGPWSAGRVMRGNPSREPVRRGPQGEEPSIGGPDGPGRTGGTT